jgi:hypothetical protein
MGDQPPLYPSINRSPGNLQTPGQFIRTQKIPAFQEFPETASRPFGFGCLSAHFKMLNCCSVCSVCPQTRMVISFYTEQGGCSVVFGFFSNYRQNSASKPYTEHIEHLEHTEHTELCVHNEKENRTNLSFLYSLVFSIFSQPYHPCFSHSRQCDSYGVVIFPKDLHKLG